MTIGELARTTGCGIETIRYYEREGLLPRTARTNGNFRRYGQEHARLLSFIRHCRSLDMSLHEIGMLLKFRSGGSTKLWRGQRAAGYGSPSRGRTHRGIAKPGARASSATRKVQRRETSGGLWNLARTWGPPNNPGQARRQLCSAYAFDQAVGLRTSGHNATERGFCASVKWRARRDSNAGPPA